jgi:hypothetical protein
LEVAAGSLVSRLAPQNHEITKTSVFFRVWCFRGNLHFVS